MPEKAAMKQVWILNHYAQEPGGAGGTRHYHLAEHLPSFGWNATVIASSVELNTGVQRIEGRQSTLYATVDQVPFLWVRTPRYSGNGGGRLLNMLTYSLRTLLPWTTKRLPRPDIIIGSSVHPFAALSGALLARRFGVPFIFEVRDLWPQTLIDMGRLRNGSFTTSLLQKLERLLYRQSTRIITLLPLAWKYITAQGIDRERIVWLPNGVDLELFTQQQPAPESGTRPFTFMYFGAHGQANGLDNIIHALKKLNDKGFSRDVRLRMIGSGPAKDSLIGLAHELNVLNIQFENPVPKAKIPQIAAEADAFVFNLIDAPVFNFGISSNKLFDFMAASRPTLFCCKSTNNPIAEACAGITVPPEDPDRLCQAMLELLHLPPEERKVMGARARKYIQDRHDFSILAERLAATLDVSLQEFGGGKPQKKASTTQPL